MLFLLYIKNKHALNCIILYLLERIKAFKYIIFTNNGKINCQIEWAKDQCLRREEKCKEWQIRSWKNDICIESGIRIKIKEYK